MMTRRLGLLVVAVAMVVDAVAVPTSALAVATSKNLLSANQASVESDLAGFQPDGAVLERSTSEAWHGSASLQVTTRGTGGYEGFAVPHSSGRHPVAPLSAYSFSLHLKGSGEPLQAVISWWDAGGKLITYSASDWHALGTGFPTNLPRTHDRYS